jgi:UDP-2-acetamido-3-amino-2,3-dideoxy-glucuronate N-acetyltransferase
MTPFNSDYMIHGSSYLDLGAEVGKDTKIWHFCHIMAGAKIGKNCVLGQNVFIADGVIIGDNVKIQNNVSVYTGVEIEDDVFLGPSCVFTNVTNPRSAYPTDHYEKTYVRKGATIGANATVVCGIELGQYCFVGAGAVVTKDVSPHALVVGVPAKCIGAVDFEGNVVELFHGGLSG